MVVLNPIGGRHRGDRRFTRSGLSLVELLIVMAAIALISGLAIPVMFRMGLFSGNKVELATRELYSALRAAKIYAATHNVDTGIAYAGLLGVEDSLTRQQPPLPVVDAYATVRRLKRDEVERMPVAVAQSMVPVSNGYPELYVFVGGEENGFVDLPRETCLLPDFFQILPGTQNTPATGLEGIVIVQEMADPLSQIPRNIWECSAPRADFAMDPINPRPLYINPNVACGSYPAHIFTPSGDIRVPDDGLPQRLTLRVGMMPDEDPSDRFTVDPTTVPDLPNFNPDDLKSPIPVLFTDDDGDPATPPEFQLYTLIRHPDTSLSETEYVDNDRRITLYRSQGRIRIEP